ncbi:MAG: hypothetical protein HY237_08100 [Acidobacteria bacterium]|nr:hypothetical protein [Acidobacteriota bacterium]
MLRAQAPPETVGRIYGNDITVKGAVGVEVENGRSTTVLASGSDVTVRTGQARLVLNEGGEIGICGPAHFSLLKSGGAVTLALDYGRIHALLGRGAPLTVYSALIVATPVAIADGPRDATMGLEQSGSMCVLSTRGAVRVEQQLTGQVLLVPQSGEVVFAEGQLDSLRGGTGTCQCEVSLPMADPPEGPRPSELSVPVPAELARPVKPPQKNAKPGSAEELPPPPIEEPIYKVMMPPLSFNAAAPAPPEPQPSPETMLLVREVRVRPAVEYHGRVEALPVPAPAAQPARLAGSVLEAPSKKHASFGSRVRGFFRRLFGRPPCKGEGCGGKQANSLANGKVYVGTQNAHTVYGQLA